MNNEFTVFNVIAEDEKLVNEFHNFFYKYNLLPLFTNEHRSPEIRVTYLDILSTIREGNKANKVLKEFADFMNTASDNKSYEEALFQILYYSSTFQVMIRKIEELMAEFLKLPDNYKHNLWNIVFYTKQLQ